MNGEDEMTGVVVAMKAGYALIETEMGDFTVAEVMGGRLDLRDEVAGPLRRPGDVTLELDAGGEIDVYVHETGCSKAVAADRVRRLSR